MHCNAGLSSQIEKPSRAEKRQMFVEESLCVTPQTIVAKQNASHHVCVVEVVSVRSQLYSLHVVPTGRYFQ
jgi:hypothetical protein